jgi:hypothetical protein
MPPAAAIDAARAAELSFASWWGSIMGQFAFVIIAIIIISTVVGAVAKLLNNLNEINAAKNRPPAGRGGAGGAGGAGGGGGATVRQAHSDMDRFLAEIDRLRKKNTNAPAPTSRQTAPVAPVVQPVKQPEKDRPRARVIAELAELPKQDTGFAPTVPQATTGPKPGDLPIPTVVTPPSGTGAPATRVTKFASRPRPVAKTPFAKNLTGLLNSGQGLAMAIVLQEILGPPRSKKS